MIDISKENFNKQREIIKQRKKQWERNKKKEKRIEK